MMGAGKPKTSFSTLMMTVLRNSRTKYGFSKSWRKWSKLFHGLPNMPLAYR